MRGAIWDLYALINTRAAYGLLWLPQTDDRVAGRARAVGGGKNGLANPEEDLEEEDVLTCIGRGSATGCRVAWLQ